MIEKLQKDKLDLQAVSVYDYDEKTLQLLLSKFYTSINECVDVSNQALEFLQWLKDIGLPQEVQKELEKMYNDGRLKDLIDSLANDVSEKYDSLVIDINTNKTNIETNKTNIETNKNNINNLNTSLQDFKTETESELQKHLNKINDICVTTQDFNIVGDGVTQVGTKIQEFLDYCSTNQVVGKVKRGTYILENQIIIKSNTTLIFEDGAEFKQVHENTMVNIQNNLHTLYNGYKNIKIIGGIFNCNGSEILNPMNCFFIQHADNVLFYGCTFKNIHSYHALDINGSSNIKVKRCSFLNSYDTISYENREAIQIDLSAPTLGEIEPCWDFTPSKNIIIEQCYFGRDNKQALYFTSAIGSHNARFNKFYDNIIIRDNVIDGNEDYGIKGWKWINSKIENNIINSTKGIKMDTPHRNAVSCNDVNGVYKGMQELYNITIKDNTINCQTDGIFLRGKWITSPVLDEEQSGLIYNCTIENNIINMENATSPCITLLNVYHSKVIDNTCNKSGDDGIRLYSSHQNIVKGNIINEPSNYGICVNGKSLTGTDGCMNNTSNIISDNIIRKSYKTGIFLSTSSSYTNVNNNTLIMCNTSNSETVSIIDVSASSNYVSITNNKIIDSTYFKNIIYVTNTCNNVLVSLNTNNNSKENKYFNASINGVLVNNI